ncbi:MAG: TlpA family protein disulfide reductase [Ignavibacteriales bacterium]|nr:TlpA family protein disulfide reductase [Ignavibacteriales bacterium]
MKWFSIIVKFLVALFLVLTLFTYCSSKNDNIIALKTISGKYANWTPFNISIYEQDGTEFKGLMKWLERDAWSYVEGEFVNNDSIIFREKYFIIGYVHPDNLTGEFRAKIYPDSIRGEWFHKDNEFSKDGFTAYLDTNISQLGELERKAIEMITTELNDREEATKLIAEVREKYKNARENNTNPETDSLQYKITDLGIRIVSSGFRFRDFYLNEYGLDTLKISEKTATNDTRNRYFTYLGLAKFNDEQLSYVQEIIDKYEPLGSWNHFSLNEQIFRQKLMKAMEKDSIPNAERADYFNDKYKNFLLSYLDKELHPQDRTNFLFSFIYGIYRDDPSYKTVIYEKLEELKSNKKVDPQSLDMISEVINKIDNAKSIIGGDAPDFKLTDINENEIQLSKNKGKVVLLEFWATWCGPCIAVTPKLKALYSNFKNKKFEMISIALDDEKAVKKYCKENDIMWTQIVPEGGWKAEISSKYGVNGVPTAFLIDINGKLVESLHPSDENLTSKIENLLNM